MKFHGKGASMFTLYEIHILAVMPLLLKCLHIVGSLGTLDYALVGTPGWLTFRHPDQHSCYRS